jgi:hypothetical protein
MKKTVCGTIGLLWYFLTGAFDYKEICSLKDFSWFVMQQYASFSFKINPVLTVSCGIGSAVIGYKLFCFVFKRMSNFFSYCYKQYRYHQQKELFYKIIQSQEDCSDKIKRTTQELQTVSQHFSNMQSRLHEVEDLKDQQKRQLEKTVSHVNQSETMLTTIKEQNSAITEEGRLFLHKIKQEQDEIEFLGQEKKINQKKTQHCLHSMNQVHVPNISFSYDTITNTQEHFFVTATDMKALMDRYSGDSELFLDSIAKSSLVSLGKQGLDMNQQIKEIAMLLAMKKEGKPV